jgi:hypothetical protein
MTVGVLAADDIQVHITAEIHIKTVVTYTTDSEPDKVIERSYL